MQKLEEVSRAEEAARKAVSTAKEQVDRTIAEANDYARDHVAGERARTATEIAALRKTRIEAAKAEAEKLTAETCASVDKELAGAKARIAAAVAAATERLVG